MWQEKFSKTHSTSYYFNIATGETSWTRPDGVDIEPLVVPDNATIVLEQNVGKYLTGITCGENNALLQSHLPVPKDDEGESSLEGQFKRRKIDESVSVSTALPPSLSDSNVIKTSYLPPSSGSAADVALLPSANLQRPIIISHLPPSNIGMYLRTDIQVNEVLKIAYVNGYVTDQEGKNQKFKDTTNPLQGRHLYNLIKENKYTRTLEVGMAMGASAVWMTQAHKDVGRAGTHIAIDPNQSSQYKSVGRHLVASCGLGSFMRVIEMTSYRALPLLLEDVLNGRIPRFHLIYIDGWHTFDYTLLDFFYADLLLEVNGVIVLDDIKHLPVKKTMKYIELNYPHYEVIPVTPVFNRLDPGNSSQATFIKKALDSRVWNHHVDF